MPDTPSPFEIGRLMMSLWVPQAIHAAAELGIADALARRPGASADELAEQLATHGDATARLLDALAVLGIVERDQCRFTLTPLGELLRSDAPSSRRAWARLMGGERVWRAWGRLSECIRTGAPAFAAQAERESETETFDVLFDEPEQAAIFHQAMADGTRSVAPDIVAAIDFAGVERVIDVGGGFGELLCAALERHPNSEGAVFDLEHARAGALASFERRGLAERASFVAGDLFRDAPPIADLLLLKSVIHDWADDRALAVLERCRAAMRPTSKLVLIEPPAPDTATQAPSSFAWVIAFSDLNMLVNTGGRERTREQYEALLSRAGLQVIELRPAGFYTCFTCVLA